MIWKSSSPGIPDQYFERDENIPMTKEEIRALTISKARLRPGDVVIDVGCGTGSLSVEASRQVSPSGFVYAIDRDKKAISLTRRNISRFHLENTVQLIHGKASRMLGRVPNADAILVGGAGEDLPKIINLSFKKLRPEGRIVINAILIETCYTALKEMSNVGFKNVEAIQVTIAKGRRIRRGTIMLARNPIMIISGVKGRIRK